MSETFTPTGPGVFYARPGLVTFGAAEVAFVKEQAHLAPLRRARLCAHPGPETNLHAMLIAALSETFIAPQRHRNRGETFLVVEGRGTIVLFGEEGNIDEIVRVGEVGAPGEIFFYWMPPNRYHMLLIETPIIVFVETTIGPFNPLMTEEPAWAPTGRDEHHAFVRDVRRQVSSDPARRS